MTYKPILLFFLLNLSFVCNGKAEHIIWQLGENNNNAREFSLAPNEYKRFLEKDFGYEDRYFLLGHSQINQDFPYVLPGPSDSWGGTGPTSGWRTHDVNVLFGLGKVAKNKKWKLVLDLVDNHKQQTVVKLSINNKSKTFRLSNNGSEESLTGNTSNAKESILELELTSADLKEGGNTVSISVLEGSWIIFDQLKLEGPDGTKLLEHDQVFIRQVSTADYEIQQHDKRYQPLLLDVEHLEKNPELSVLLDDKEIFSSKLDTGRYIFEALMPAVSKDRKSKYKVLVNGKVEQEGIVWRSKKRQQTLANYVDTKTGTAHSRWMIAPGPWMPFSMVKISPDNQNAGWQAGYQPTFESVGTFSHIHEWTMGGLGLMPVNGPLKTKIGDEKDNSKSGYRSAIDKSTERAQIGKYEVLLTDYNIKAEMTATTRASFSRYTFPKDKDGRVMIDMHINAEYDYQLLDVKINKVSDYRIEGSSHQLSPRPHVWSNDADQNYVVNFVIEFDQPIKNVGGWVNNDVKQGISTISGKNLKDAGMFVEFETSDHAVVQARTGISMVSIENAAENLKKEITDPFGWNFENVEANQIAVWNGYLDRIKIQSNDRNEKIRFYNNMYRSICSRNTWSDINGDWVGPDNTKHTLQNPEHRALGCDAFWNTFWNLNQFWNLVIPEWSSRWVNSQLAMYDANGWLAKGPAGMKYIPVMVAEHEIPLIVSAYQMGIRDFDSEKAFEAANKMQTTPAQPVAGGFAGNRDLKAYLKYGYVPTDKGRFSNTLEYAYDDWTVSQFAKSLGKDKAYAIYSDRGNWWKNAMDRETGYARLKNSEGKFETPFDPFRSGKNEHYVEGNAWQLTYFVPQDVKGLADYIGKDKFLERLEWGFKVSEPWRYNAPNDQYWDFPVVQGNQQSMHFAFLFNWVGKPWLTQKWSRSIVDRYYGSGQANAYLGDEDQGQMSAWFIMASLGLFQTDGGASVDPIYEIGSPMFENIEIDLGNRYNRGGKFVINAKNASRKNVYVQQATLNGTPLKSFKFSAKELLKGGNLVLEMGATPNMNWGVE
ncbi:GH92 family glycosyl hydrolase [Sphingobacterium sp. SRCM116780]|uniref:GH92 family glycosyl hydrolase n=1 Tax=Sphingobacterium sp. SRCM116780 TaxID=2907623 RepID=UPI001F2FCC15|nr:GH92 family glycosyl hydrolase [Sphingobacterium sp. SRCM116780]UIR57685.1 GH92 family glycosyl hydrolase [Sphingobacterium sp. SRCM116780]